MTCKLIFPHVKDQHYCMYVLYMLYNKQTSKYVDVKNFNYI